ncbi:MAG TPA: 1-acyl-sn-glycerol-3-phosphate acyltransferase [Campylobacterales bacterium]|nr:1-acyl-sn-glycerol-3-phosphate acyltransferase [Campylobacterales bacterium]HHS93365.1 1-acyl-sn-glycerol-3-phosphate acyltransferase [Campylobacterales bacterium]
MKIFAKIRFYYGATVISTIVAGIMIPLIMIRRKNASNVLHFWNAVIMRLLGGNIVIHGERDNSVDMFVANHQGIIDIIAIEAQENTDIQWVAKRQLFETPWFGYLLRLPKMICVDRENKTGLIKLIRDVKESITSPKKRVIGIFPEGTRNDTQELTSFKAGTKIVAEKLELTIQPIVITNSKKLLNEHNKTAHSAEVHLSYLEPFKASKTDKEWYNKLQNKMQEAIDKEYNEHQRER